MKIIYADKKTMLMLGRQGEHHAVQIIFSLTEWMSLYGSGQAELIYQRPGDERPYIMDIQQDGTNVFWNITDYHTAVSGKEGQCELRYYLEDGTVKSKIWKTFVETSLDTPTEEEPPAPEKGWFDAVLQAAAKAENSADAANQSARKAESALTKSPIIGENRNWFIWDSVSESYIDTGRYSAGVSPRIGDNGNWFTGNEDSGVKATGPQGPKPEKGIDYWTAADQESMVNDVLAALPNAEGVYY